ncbi:MAG TPA: hypothetical protein VG125_10145, partial [Pirellulales bacterium]|nr:hypothetical protein [Pirellulales bacterium]
MFRLLLVWTLTGVRHNRSSAIVTIAAIAVGVATVESVSTALEMAREAHRALVSPLDTGAALSIVADRDEFFPPSSARVRDVPGVESLVPAVTAHVLLICGD